MAQAKCKTSDELKTMATQAQVSLLKLQTEATKSGNSAIAKAASDAVSALRDAQEVRQAS